MYHPLRKLINGQDMQIFKSLPCLIQVKELYDYYALYIYPYNYNVDVYQPSQSLSCIIIETTGCEFFKDYRDNGYNPVCLQYDWSLVSL